MSELLNISELRCACGSDQIAAVDPGDAPEETDALGVRTVLLPGRRIVARCLACWPMALGVQQELFGTHVP